jgi:primosomal protein N' (replication factor Y) (superfamily II helicase)
MAKGLAVGRPFSYISPAMISHRRLVKVAIAGPLRRTFTYHLSEETGPLDSGRRVLVEFGRRRMVGFCLGEGEPVHGVTSKPIIRWLDPATLFPRELFDLGLWIADYYFANPADCLSCALPPSLKTTQPLTLRWAGQPPEATPRKVVPFFRSDKQLTPAVIDSLRRLKHSLLAELIDLGVVCEEWPEAAQKGQETVRAFRAIETDRWKAFFEPRRFQPLPFSGELDREALLTAGWTEHYLRSAQREGLLEPVYEAAEDDILAFVTPKEGVGDLLPNPGQQRAIDELCASLDRQFAVTLLHGVTGSGKTLVYCHTVRKAIESGGSALVLTPEIALSGTTLAYFRGFFGDVVTVIHSAMTERERLESWRGIRQGKYRVVIGPRSALFAPLVDLRLIIVDEEHDSSYKQADPSPRFHGRDAAIMRAKINRIPILLGSASPSLESYYHARSGKYRLLTLDERPAGATLPRVTVIDMATQRLHGDTPYLSFMLKKEIDRRLELDHQVILFLNRRGYSPQLKCADCGHVPICPHCEIKLTYHKAGKKLTCHYCGYVVVGYNFCEKCAGSQFLYPGAGTQKVEEHVARLFEQGRVLRFDSDTASGRKNAHRLLHEFAERKYNLLLGTQMVTKGLDLSGVTLVGVLSADHGIDLPDFRASEKTFSRLLQVAGRSGRGQSPGDVFIQTYYPESAVIADAARQDYVGFFEREIESRRLHRFPPFSRLVRVVLAASDKTQVDRAISRFASELSERSIKQALKIDILGPTACPISLLRGLHRQHLLIRTLRPLDLGRLLTAWEEEQSKFGLPATVKISVDVDPDDMM